MNQEPQGREFPQRWDPQWIAERTRRESARLGYAGHENRKHTMPLAFCYRFLKWGLQAVGLYERGYRNFKDIQLKRESHYLLGWLPSLTGFRILQISDLHLDLDPGIMDPLCTLIKDVTCDLVVFTGDFWEGSHADPAPALADMDRILSSLPRPKHGFFGVLGNHDSVELGAALESRGIKILVNEAVTIETAKGSLALAGVDDAYYFRLDDVMRAARQCPEGMPKILLSHSPQLAPEARDEGFTFMLSGHTHGGQICLPGGFSPITMDNIPPPLFRGTWHQGSLVGYTTTGTGSCHLPVRYNCPPEVVLHSLDHTP